MHELNIGTDDAPGVEDCDISRAGVPEANSCRPTDESHEAGQERSGYEYSPVKLHVWS